jgi:hypothetical protein
VRLNLASWRNVGRYSLSTLNAQGTSRSMRFRVAGLASRVRRGLGLRTVSVRRWLDRHLAARLRGEVPLAQLLLSHLRGEESARVDGARGGIRGIMCLSDTAPR